MYGDEFERVKLPMRSIRRSSRRGGTIMSERTTGATDAKFTFGVDSLTVREQEENGVQLYACHWHQTRIQRVWIDVPPSDRNQIAARIAEPGMVIAAEADVLPEHVRDAIQHIVDQHRREMSASGEDFSVVSNWLDRAIADGGAK